MGASFSHVPPARFSILGNASVREHFAVALEAGRLFPAWLLSGQSGIGKAQTALQCALMALGAKAGTPLERAALAGAHPDFCWMCCEDKKQDIPVAAIQELPRFFAKSAAMGGWRVAVVDALDALNRFGMNGLLKIVEEPPAGGLFLLVHHGEKDVPATLSSRCHRVRMHCLSADDMRIALANAGAGAFDADMIALAGGRPGRALALLRAGAFDTAAAAKRLLDTASSKGIADLLTAAGRSEDMYEAIVMACFQWCRDHAVRAEAREDAASWAGAVADLSALYRDRQELALDRTQTIAAMFERVAGQPG